MSEFWRAAGPGRLDPRHAAVAVEAAGWDGQMFMDSQSLSADPYVLMSQWLGATTKLRVATGVTNPLTRHVVVTAGAAATLQAISGGRYVAGVGRGDSALAYLGYSPSPVRDFARFIESLQLLLSGRPIPFGGDSLQSRSKSFEEIAGGDRPDGARLEWLPDDVPKVPVDVAATGPKVIQLGARLADRLTFSVGAMPRRLEWAIETARDVQRDTNVTSGPISFGAQIVVVCHPDIEAVREVATRLVLPLARFQVLHGGKAAGPKFEEDDRAYASIREGYEMTRHSDFESSKSIESAVDFDFVRRFAVVGPPDHCTARLIELAGVGIDRFVVFGPGYHDDGERDGTLFAKEVLPAVRAELRVGQERRTGKVDA